MSSYTGQEIGGYQIGPLLGVGGMGEVYQATDPETNTLVAVKFLRSDFDEDTEVQSRFIREIRIMESLEHDRIVPIFKYGIVDGSTLYYAMRLIHGMAFSTMLKRDRFSPYSYWPILKQVTEALEFGHTQGVVHRDIKPDNVFIEKHPDGSLNVFLGDFGLGKRKGVDVTLTEADAIIGTPHYMSPESIMGEHHDKRSDIYSLAVVSYEALTGAVPFNEEHAHQTAIAHVTQPPPPPTSHNPDFPLAMENVLLKGLMKSADDRQQTAQQFADEYYDAMMTLDEEARHTIY
jgi:serine/threonine-protein kinase